MKQNILAVIWLVSSLYSFANGQCTDRQVKDALMQANLLFNSNDFKKSILPLCDFIIKRKPCNDKNIFLLLDSLKRYSYALEMFHEYYQVLDKLEQVPLNAESTQKIKLYRYDASVQSYNLNEADKWYAQLQSLNLKGKELDDFLISTIELLSKKFLYDSARTLIQNIPPGVELRDLKNQFRINLLQLNILGNLGLQNSMIEPLNRCKDILDHTNAISPEWIFEYLHQKTNFVHVQDRATAIKESEQGLSYLLQQNPAIQHKYLPIAYNTLAHIWRNNYKIRKSDTLLQHTLTLFDSTYLSHSRIRVMTHHLLTSNAIAWNDMTLAKTMLSKADAINRQIPYPDPKSSLLTTSLYNSIYSRTKEYDLLLQNAKNGLKIALSLPFEGYNLYRQYGDLVDACTYAEDTTDLRSYLRGWEAHFTKYEKEVPLMRKGEYLTAMLKGYIFLDDPGYKLNEAEAFYNRNKETGALFIDELKAYIADANYNLGNQEKGLSMRKIIFEKAQKAWLKEKSIGNFNHYTAGMVDYYELCWNKYKDAPTPENKMESELAEKAVDDYVLIAARDHPQVEQVHFNKNRHASLIDIDAEKYMRFHDKKYLWSAISKQEIFFNRRLVKRVIDKKALNNCLSERTDIEKHDSLVNQFLIRKDEYLAISGSNQGNLNEKLNALELHYRSGIDSLLTHNPCYKRWEDYELSSDIPGLAHKILTQDDCIISFNYKDSFLTTFFISPDTAFLLRESSPGIIQTIERFISIHTKYFIPKMADPDLNAGYATLSNELHRKLIRPIMPFLKRNILMLQSEGFQFLPIESLISDLPSQVNRVNTWSFLNQDHTISYLHSMNLYVLMHDLRPISNTRIAFAPFAKVDSTLDYSKDDVVMRSALRPLESSGEEVNKVCKSIKGISYTGKMATKSNFLNSCSDAGIIHIASHGDFDSLEIERSFISFQAEKGNTPEKLFYGRLLGMNIQADLVTLSSCFSGKGQSISAEGVHSMAQAFTIAGARNTVAALWPVPDVPTKELMILFYQEIKSGKSYSESLASAKRSFIQKFKPWAHPVYWAGFVLNGR
jgi:CHAT domain-containing protein